MSLQKAWNAKEKQRRNLSFLLYTFPKLDWETAHFKPEFGAWTPAWVRSIPAFPHPWLQESPVWGAFWGATGCTAGFSVECEKEA